MTVEGLIGRDTMLSGWGRSTWSRATVSTVADGDAVATAVHGALRRRSARPAGAPERGVLPRGLGRAYGDAAQNGGGLVLDLTGCTGIGEIQPDGVVEVAAGTSIGALIDHVVPHGWFVPVTPGTRHVTVGGALAADVHGKNHHRDASIGAHVVDVTLVDGLGEVRVLAAGDVLLGAVLGGMGLSGVIVAARLMMQPIETASITVHTSRTRDLDETMAALVAADASHRYTVAWLDTLAPGRRAGRAVLTSGDHTPGGDAAATPLAWHLSGRAVPAPSWAPSGLVRHSTARAFNEAYYRMAPATPTVGPAPLTAFFHPLDVVHGWNRAYGRVGFLQYQFAVADPKVVTDVLELFRRERITTFLPVLKRFGPGIQAPLSFPTPGWTLAVDVPADPATAATLDRADDIVVAAGGRCYLAKDARVRPQLIPDMYPDLDRWRELRGRLDPDGLFVSDLSRRLALC